MTDKQDKLIPKLRFPEFNNDGEWEFRRLGDIADSFSGGTPTASKADYYGGDIPFIRSGEVNSPKTSLFITQPGLENSSAKMVEKGTILYALYGATSGEVGLAGVKGAINQAILAIVPKPGVDKLFLFQYLKYAKGLIVNHFIQGGQGNLSASIISNLIIPLPSLSEQKRIAAFLTSLDELLSKTKAKLEQLKAHKKALLQRLFPAPGETTPEYRFADCNNGSEWPVKRLGELFCRIVKKNTENNQNVLTISAQFGLVSQSDYFHKSVSSNDITNYILIQRGDFAYNKSRSQGYPYGTAKSLQLYEKGVVSPVYLCFRPRNVKTNTLFYGYYFESESFNLELGRVAQEGARNHGLLNISPSDFFENIRVAIPQPKEQEKIAQSLSSIDSLILTYSTRLSQIERYKNGLLQQLFPPFE